MPEMPLFQGVCGIRHLQTKATRHIKGRYLNAIILANSVLFALRENEMHSVKMPKESVLKMVLTLQFCLFQQIF